MPLFMEINTSLNLAPLNDKRVPHIRQAFSHVADPNTPVNYPMQLLIAHNAEKMESVVFSDNQTNYILDQIKERIDLKRFFDPIKGLLERFALDERFNATVTMRWVRDLPMKNTMGLTTSKINPEFGKSISEIWGPFEGVGFRFLQKNDDGTISEFKIEPYIQNSNMIFVESISNFIQTNEFELIVQIEKLIAKNDKAVDMLISVI